MSSMMIRRIAKTVVAALLTAGLFGAAAAPVVSAPNAKMHTQDTGWGRR